MKKSSEYCWKNYVEMMLVNLFYNAGGDPWSFSSMEVNIFP